MPHMTGGQAVIETLASEGVDTVFGIISVHMLPIYDALYHEPSIRLIVPRHEMAGGFMADGYSRVSGRPGVYLTSTGPGAANSAGAVLEAWTGSSRTLQLTGQIDTPYLDQGKGFLHEIRDQRGMFEALGARTGRVMAPQAAPGAIHEAMGVLRATRPRPYIIEMPIDQQYRADEVAIGSPLEGRPPQPDERLLDQAADLLRQARRPVLWLGGGVNSSGAHAEAQQVAEALGAAVFTTRGGRGSIPEDHPLVVGNYFSEPAGRAFLEAADVVLAVGSRFGMGPTHSWQLKLNQLIRIDIDPTEVNHNYTPILGIAADAKPALAGLAARLTQPHAVSDTYLAEITQLRAQLRGALRDRAPLTMAMMDTIRASMPRETIFVTDSTLPAYTGGNQYLPVYARRGFVSPHSVAIGPGLPFALGAQAAAPDQPVVCIAGDGGFMLHATELATAAEARLNVIVCLFNNRGYGILRRYQRSRFEGRFIGVDLLTPDFVKLADSMGVQGERVTEASQLGPALNRALAANAPVLLDIQAPFE